MRGWYFEVNNQLCKFCTIQKRLFQTTVGSADLSLQTNFYIKDQKIYFFLENFLETSFWLQHKLAGKLMVAEPTSSLYVQF